MNASDFDQVFDNDENITGMIDMTKAVRPALEQRRVNVDLPHWMIAELDHEATRVGVTRQSIIKVWLAERLQQIHSPVG